MGLICKLAVYSNDDASEILMLNIPSKYTIVTLPTVKCSPWIFSLYNYVFCCCCRKLSVQIFTDAKPQILKPPTQSSTEGMKVPRVNMRTELCPFSSMNTCPYIPRSLFFSFGDGKIWQISDTWLTKWEDMLTFSWPVQNLKQKCQKEICYSQHNMNFKLSKS